MPERVIFDQGRLNKRVTLQQPTRVQSLSGQVSNTWSDIATVWAAVEPLKGKDLWQSQQVQSLVTATITIRYRTDVDDKWRIKFRGRFFNIGQKIDIEEKHEYLQLLCIEAQA